MDDYNMAMVAGDTLCFGIEVDGLEDEVTGASFAAKLDLDSDLVFEKTLGDGIEATTDGYMITLPPEDTESLEAGQYYYQLKLEVEDDVFTILKGILKIERSIGNV